MPDAAAFDPMTVRVVRRRRTGEDRPERPAARKRKADYSALAAELRPLIGQPVDLVYGVGSRQVKFCASGRLVEVTRRQAVLRRATVRGDGAAYRTLTLFVPLSLVVRYSQ